ncbi:MAG: hypothetical protein QME79_08690, partial [Bacillota bacterium]|nr:hypothetical protein [Bacillota bacterium]
TGEALGLHDQVQKNVRTPLQQMYAQGTSIRAVGYAGGSERWRSILQHTPNLNGSLFRPVWV